MKFILTLTVLTISTMAFSQAISRQSINSLGASTIINNVIIEQSVGQPYQSAIIESDDLQVRPGFIQSRFYNIKELMDDKEIDITVFPNPATESFTVKTDEHFDEVTIQVSGVTGNVLEHITLKDFQNKQINCSGWSNGTYFITVLTNDGRRNNSKLIITK